MANLKSLSDDEINHLVNHHREELILLLAERSLRVQFVAERDLYDACIRACRDGRPVDAIRQYRVTMRVGLREAMDMVNTWQVKAGLRNE